MTLGRCKPQLTKGEHTHPMMLKCQRLLTIRQFHPSFTKVALPSGSGTTMPTRLVASQASCLHAHVCICIRIMGHVTRI